MPSDASKFKAPYINQQKCWSAADDFRQKYWSSGAVPVDVLSIAEFELNLEFRTSSTLREECDTDALLLGNWKTIIVDQQEYMDPRFLNKLRWSIAHELGHFALHKDVFESVPRSNQKEWINFVLEMPDKEYGLLEYHANEFAGRLLVPIAELKSQFESELVKMEEQGLRRRDLTDANLLYLCIPLGKYFAVSQEVIERRLNREKLWPLR